MLEKYFKNTSIGRKQKERNKERVQFKKLRKKEPKKVEPKK